MNTGPKPAAELSAIEPDGKGLRVRFYQEKDRYRHVVEMIEAGRATPLLESVELGGELHWPPSPPFQNLYVQERGDLAPVISLTGATSQCHWSGAVTVGFESFPDAVFAEYRSEHVPNDSRRQIVFDIACRYRARPNWLGSSYRPVDTARVGITPAFAFAGDGHAALAIAPRREYLLPEPDESPDCVVREVYGPTGASVLTMQPPEKQIHPSPATTRWAYRMIRATI